MAGSSSLPDETSNVKWMYEGTNSTIDRESYLLGKRITKVPEEKGDFIVETTANENLSVTVLERLDYESKVREDPLFSIKKKEDEKRRELLSNPIKRKHLQNVLRNALVKDLESSHKHKKEKHRRKSTDDKHRKTKRKSSSSESSDDSDTRPDKNSLKLLKNAHRDKNLHAALKKALEKDLKVNESDSSDSSSENEEKRHRKKSSKKHKREKHVEERNHHHSRRERTPKRKSPEKPRKRMSSAEEEKPKPKGYGLIVVKPQEKKTGSIKKRRTSSPELVKEKYVRKEKPGFTRKLNKEELERKRREMMSNADWRDDQRRKNVKQYTNEEKVEKERESHIKKIHDKQMRDNGKVKTFLHDMKLKRATDGSLADTVRRKRHTLDRTSKDT